MKRTISVMIGKGSVKHNNRDFTAENVDAKRTQNNIVYCNENIKSVYHQLFDEALEKYNSKQTRKDRMINDYYEKIRTGKQEKLFHEVILQIGNKEDMYADSENGRLAKTVLDKYMKNFQERNTNLKVFSAHLHMDEATPHLHIDFIPFTTGSKRGLETRVSLKKALEAQGFRGGTKSNTEWNQWVEAEKEKLSEVMLEYGIEWEKKNTHEKHKSVNEFKRDMLVKEVEELNEKKENLEQKISAYKKSEEYAVHTAKQIQNNDNYSLPSSPTLMSAKAYKNKYAEPVVKKLTNFIQNLAGKYFRAEKEAKQAKEEVSVLYAENQSLKAQVWKQNIKISKMGVELRRFTKIKDYVGAEQVNEWIKIINKTAKNKDFQIKK